jgi:hypothetical protein
VVSFPLKSLRKSLTDEECRDTFESPRRATWDYFEYHRPGAWNIESVAEILAVFVRHYPTMLSNFWGETEYRVQETTTCNSRDFFTVSAEKVPA